MSAEPDRIPLSAPSLDGNDWAYVKECLDSTWVSSGGPFVERFEHNVAKEVGARHAVATVNGTAALHTALLVAGIGAGDEVLVPALTFIATANAVAYAGATPVAVDVDPDHAHLDPAAARSYLRTFVRRSAKGWIDQRTRRRVRALLPVHALGHPCDMDPLLELAEEYELTVIEDAAESLGSLYKGRATGGLGRVGCLSFNGNKIVTAGGGGMLVTNDGGLAERARYLTTQAKDDPVRYIHKEVGFNYRLPAVQAALGCAQLERLRENVERKRQIAAAYRKGLERAETVDLMGEAAWAKSNFWLSTARFSGPGAPTAMEVVQALAKQNIEARPLWQPLHRSAAHPGPHGACPNADKLHAKAVSLPSSVSLTQDEQDRVLRALSSVLERSAEPRASRR